MTTTIFRNRENVGMDEVLTNFTAALKESELYNDSEIEMLSEIYAKNPVDKFIVSGDVEATDDSCQGDIIVLAEGTNMYNEVIGRIKNLQKTDRLVLQEGDSITGDHRIIPAEGSTYTIKKGTFTPKFLEGQRRWGGDAHYTAITFETDKPFIIFHREHGNMARCAGKYVFYSQLDPATLNRMMD